MSLLSTDITKIKRLSLRRVKLPAPELRAEPITPMSLLKAVLTASNKLSLKIPGQQLRSRYRGFYGLIRSRY